MTARASAEAVVVAIDRRAAWGLVAFGGSGLVLACALALALLVILQPIVTAAAAFERQRSSAVATLDAASTALRSTASAADGATTSLGDAESALRDASAATGQLADAAAGLAALSGSFAETANTSRSLSDKLSLTADAVTSSMADSQAVAAEFRTLALRVDDFSASLGGPSSGIGTILGSSGPVILVGLGFALLGWLGVGAAACLWLGRRALRMEAGLPGSGGRAPASG